MPEGFRDLLGEAWQQACSGHRRYHGRDDSGRYASRSGWDSQDVAVYFVKSVRDNRRERTPAAKSTKQKV